MRTPTKSLTTRSSRCSMQSGKGTVAKEAIPEILVAVAGGSTVEAAMAKLAPTVSRDELEAVIKKIVADRKEFIVQKQKGAFGTTHGCRDAGGPGVGGREGCE